MQETGQSARTPEFVLAVDLGGTNIKSAVVDDEGQILAFDIRETRAEGGARAVLRRIAVAVEDVCAQAGIDFEDTRGLGLGIPGTVLPERGRIVLAPNLGWHNYDLLPDFRQLLPGLGTICLENDAALATLGEAWVGAARGKRNVLGVTLGTGVGSGLLLDGGIYNGSSGRGVELGHFKVSGHNNPCSCGNQGCLETLVSAPALRLRIREILGLGIASRLRGSENLQVEDVFAAAAEGDPAGSYVVAEMTSHLALALANACLLVDPEVIVIGGGVVGAGNTLLVPLRRKIIECLHPYAGSILEIKAASLGNKAGVIGAAALVLCLKGGS